MTTPAAFSIVPFTSIDDLPEPTNGPYIVATKTGYMVYRNFHFGRVLVQTETAPLTPEAVPTLWHDIDPLIPASLIGQALSFFKAIYEKRHSEAMVDITWHPEQGYRLFIPPQQATHGGVKCQRTPEHYVGQMVGTIHSHCDFGAFHSSTDTHDADGHDGLHITIGDVMKPNPSIDIMMSVNKKTWGFTLDEISDGPLELHPHPEWWERYVKDPIPTTTAITKTPGQIISFNNRPTPSPYNRPLGAIVDATFDNAYNPYSTIAYNLDTLLWRYSHWTDEEIQHIGEATDLIEQLRDALDLIGIEMDTQFSVDPTTTKRQPNSDVPDDDTIAQIWLDENFEDLNDIRSNLL